MDYSYFDVIRSRMSSDTNNSTAVNGRFPAQTPLGMAYVPFQTWEDPYDAADGLHFGTMFPKLNMPLSGEEALRSER